MQIKSGVNLEDKLKEVGLEEEEKRSDESVDQLTPKVKELLSVSREAQKISTEIHEVVENDELSPKVSYSRHLKFAARELLNYAEKMFKELTLKD